MERERLEGAKEVRQSLKIVAMKNLLPFSTASLLLVMLLTSSKTNAQQLNTVQSGVRDFVLCLCGPTVLTESSYQVSARDFSPVNGSNLDGNTTQSRVVAEWFLDEDKDGLGNPLEVQISYEQPDGYVSNSNDPDDGVVDRLCSKSEPYCTCTIH